MTNHNNKLIQYRLLPSILSSFSLSLYGVFKLTLLFNHFNSLIFKETEIDIFMTDFFICYLFLDMFLHFYLNIPMNLLTVKVHHPCYILFLIALRYHHMSNIFTLFTIEEIPTFLLNLGNYDKNLRNDNLFGFTFLNFRVIYHILLTSLLLSYSYIPFYSKIVGIITSILHCYWFGNWMVKYYLT